MEIIPNLAKAGKRNSKQIGLMHLLLELTTPEAYRKGKGNL